MRHFAQVILPLPIINCAAQCVLCSHFGIDWNVHEFFAPETLLFSCSNLFSVIDIHSTGSWSKWLLVLGNLRASTLQVRSLNDHLLSSQKTCVFRGLLCVSENFVFRDGNLSSVMNWLNSCRLINNTARTGRFLLKWTNQVILNPYTAERRDVSENTPPEAQEISQGRGFCTPRPERLPEGEARGQSRGPIRELLILLLDNRWR